VSPRARAVRAGQLPTEVEQLADAISKKEGIDLVSARWYAIGCMHTADAMIAERGTSEPHEAALAYVGAFAAGERRRGGRS